jgi:tRNA-dihydrouridine synthase B
VAGVNSCGASDGLSAEEWPLARPLQVGSVRLPNRVALAPLAGITTSAYRMHVKRYGAGLVCTEMVSAYGLLYGNRRTQEYLEFREGERPLAVQLFGDTPETLGRAASMVIEHDRRPDLLDINMGCPVRKVVKTGAGAAMLAEPAKAAAAAAAVVRAAAAAGIPVTVKLRSGLEPGREVAVEVAVRLEQAGVAALCVHPRAASQFYHGTADHGVTTEVVSAVGIPVFASGDVVSAAAAGSVMADTGAAGVMVARGGLGRPWLVQDVVSGLDRPRPPLAAVVADLRALLFAATADMGPERAARWMRKQLAWYLRPSGVPGAVVAELHLAPDAAALDAALADLVDPCVDMHAGVCL